ncbi:MAG: hypothetical protein ACQCN6_01725 [Candidatus Bathyarchaeia archaeon]|jgi:hypothetical protein
MHRDFQKILNQFIGRYGKTEGSERFYAWVNKRGLDDAKPYSPDQLKQSTQECLSGCNPASCLHNCRTCLQESFQWAKPLIKLLKKDKDAKYYQVEAHFAVTSMNGNIYTLEEMMQAIHTLPAEGTVDLNHNREWVLPKVDISAAQVENGCSECIIRVPNGTQDAKKRDVQECFDDGTYHAVSIEADSEDVERTAAGNKPVGMKYTGLAVLDGDALPGIPLTTIAPLEALMESIYREVEASFSESLSHKEVSKKMEKNIEETKKEIAIVTEAQVSFCPVCGVKTVDGKCPNEDCEVYGAAIVAKSEANPSEATALNQKVADLTSELTAKTQEAADNHAEAQKARRDLASASERLSNVTKENLQIGVQNTQIEALKKSLVESKSEAENLRGKNAGYTETISKLETEINKEHKENQRLQERIGSLEVEAERTRRDLNEESERRASAEQKALNATKECSRVKLESSNVLEGKAGDTRQISELSEKVSVTAKAQLKLEEEAAGLRKENGTLKEALTARQEQIEAISKHQKKLYKALERQGIALVDPETGNIISSPS